MNFQTGKMSLVQEKGRYKSENSSAWSRKFLPFLFQCWQTLEGCDSHLPDYFAKTFWLHLPAKFPNKKAEHISELMMMVRIKPWKHNVYKFSHKKCLLDLDWQNAKIALVFICSYKKVSFLLSIYVHPYWFQVKKNCISMTSWITKRYYCWFTKWQLTKGKVYWKANVWFCLRESEEILGHYAEYFLPDSVLLYITLVMMNTFTNQRGNHHTVIKERLINKIIEHQAAFSK